MIFDQSRYNFGTVSSGGVSTDIVRTSGQILHALQLVVTGYSAPMSVLLQGSLDNPTQTGAPFKSFVPTNFFTMGTASITANGVYVITYTGIADYVRVSYPSGTGTLNARYALGHYQ